MLSHVSECILQVQSKRTLANNDDQLKSSFLSIHSKIVNGIYQKSLLNAVKIEA